MKKLIVNIMICLFVLFNLINLSYAVGWHTATEILDGVFGGDYVFEGDVNFTNANVIGIETNEISNIWNKSVNDIFYNLGNVGIGRVPNSNYMLDVNGTINSRGIKIGDSVLNHIAADGAFYRYNNQVYISTDDNFYIRDTVSTGLINLKPDGNTYFNNDGNVGIGDSTPSYKLDVNGEIRATNNIRTGDKIITSRYGMAGTYNSAQVQGIWSMGNAYQIDTGSDDFGNLYGMGYAYNKNGGSPFSTEHQIVFTNNGAVNAAIGLTNGKGYFKGNVGIGTTSPNSKLEVVGSRVMLSGGTTDLFSYSLEGTDNSGMKRNWVLYNMNDYGGRHNFEIYEYTDNKDGSYCDGDGYCNNRFTIETGGNVGIGTINPSSKLHVVGDAYFTSGLKSNGMTFGKAYPGYSATWPHETIGLATNYNLRVNFGSTERFIFQNNGVARSTVGWTTYSDIRLKENIEPIKDSLNKILQLNGVEYNLKDSDSHSIGVIAQDVEKILPEVVFDSMDDEGYKSVDYAKFTPILIEAIKELKKEKDKEIEELKRDIEELKK